MNAFNLKLISKIKNLHPEACSPQMRGLLSAGHLAATGVVGWVLRQWLGSLTKEAQSVVSIAPCAQPYAAACDSAVRRAF